MEVERTFITKFLRQENPTLLENSSKVCIHAFGYNVDSRLKGELLGLDLGDHTM